MACMNVSKDSNSVNPTALNEAAGFLLSECRSMRGAALTRTEEPNN